MSVLCFGLILICVFLLGKFWGSLIPDLAVKLNYNYTVATLIMLIPFGASAFTVARTVELFFQQYFG